MARYVSYAVKHRPLLNIPNIANYGFSIGIGDVTPGEKLRNDKEELVRKAYAASKDLIVQSKAGKLQNQPGCDAEQTLEAVISGVLSKVRTEVGEICMTELSRHNAPLIMATCGSKGNLYLDLIAAALTQIFRFKD